MPKKYAFLFGPFIGSLGWEMYRFAPYAIYLKKKEPDVNLIVLTRPERFDLYGQYADVLVPLRIKGEENYQQKCFKIYEFPQRTYDSIKISFLDNYKDRYKIKDMFCPDIRNYKFRVKWQFPRSEMDYDFKPRLSNNKIVNNMKRTSTFVDLSWLKEQNSKEVVLKSLINSKIDFTDYENLEVELDKNSSLLGYVIEIIKRARVTVGNLNSPISHLSVLLKTKLLSLDDDMTRDDVHLLNPLNTEVIQYNGVLERLKTSEEDSPCHLF